MKVSVWQGNNKQKSEFINTRSPKMTQDTNRRESFPCTLFIKENI